jgi:hypothetical protein
MRGGLQSQSLRSRKGRQRGGMAAVASWKGILDLKTQNPRLCGFSVSPLDMSHCRCRRAAPFTRHPPIDWACFLRELALNRASNCLSFDQPASFSQPHSRRAATWCCGKLVLSPSNTHGADQSRRIPRPKIPDVENTALDVLELVIPRTNVALMGFLFCRPPRTADRTRAEKRQQSRGAR